MKEEDISGLSLLLLKLTSQPQHERHAETQMGSISLKPTPSQKQHPAKRIFRAHWKIDAESDVACRGYAVHTLGLGNL